VECGLERFSGGLGKRKEAGHYSGLFKNNTLFKIFVAGALPSTQSRYYSDGKPHVTRTGYSLSPAKKPRFAGIFEDNSSFKTGFEKAERFALTSNHTKPHKLLIPESTYCSQI
jgi:hypothetical protein